jgi:hypothetical protein
MTDPGIPLTRGWQPETLFAEKFATGTWACENFPMNNNKTKTN